MKKINKILLVSFISITIAIISALSILLFTTPKIDNLTIKNPDETAFMKGCNANLKYNFVPIENISPIMQRAAMVAEDSRFYEHNGIDFEALKEALIKDIKRKEFAFGASTITMQLARNLYLEPSKTIFRKARELMIATKLEKTLSKQRILELYLNVVQFGKCIYGVEAASKHYFNKPASALDAHEAAFLAAILPRPSYYQNNPNSNFLGRRIAFIEKFL